MATLSPYRFRRCSGEETAFLNQLFQKDPGLTFALGSETYRVAFEPAVVSANVVSSLMAHVRMDARIGFELHPEEQMLAMMLSNIASVHDVKALPEELRCVALEAALEKVLDRIDHISGAQSTIDRMPDTQSETPYATQIHFCLIRLRDGLRGRGYLRTDIAGLEWMAARWNRLSSKVANLLDHIPVAGRIEVGSARLSLAEFNDLEPLDIVLAKEAAAWNDRRIMIAFSPGVRLAGNMLQPDRFLIQELVTDNREENEMTNLNSSDAADAQLPMEDIPVELVFEIGRSEMSLGELRRLQPGYTVQLEASVDISRPVILKVNGLPVGNGEIVQIDDRLGIRILEFSREFSPAANG